ncbi:MAG: PilZ domain-containing protein [Gammaproteobacteria bacterium]|nr:PilZ domain-containing protein [Gammaproteobacteria bacterium]
MTHPENPQERRHFTRIPFDAQVTISQDDKSWQTQLLDISLHGVLLECPDQCSGQTGDSFSIELPLAEESSIKINGSVAHMEGNQIGLSFDNMGLESASHLKRLLLLNLGDQDLIDREIHELITIHSTADPVPPTGA